MKKLNKKQLIEKLSQFDKIIWEQKQFNHHVHSISRSEALSSLVSSKELNETTSGTCYSTKLNNYSIGLFLHTTPSEHYEVYEVIVYDGPYVGELAGEPVLKLNKLEAKRLCILVDKQVQTYLAEENKKDKKREERKERLEQNKEEIKVLEDLLK